MQSNPQPEQIPPPARFPLVVGVNHGFWRGHHLSSVFVVPTVGVVTTLGKVSSRG